VLVPCFYLPALAASVAVTALDGGHGAALALSVHGN